MIASNSETKVKTLVILLNMGGPQNKDEIHPYLKELFQDRELLKLPFQKVLGRFIAWRRTPKIQERYEEIGQYSPTKSIMEDQCSEIAKKLDLIHPASAPHICVSGFRYCSPRTGEMIEKYKNAEKIILFSQYPQHSCSTSGSSFCDAYRWPTISITERRSTGRATVLRILRKKNNFFRIFVFLDHLTSSWRTIPKP